MAQIAARATASGAFGVFYVTVTTPSGLHRDITVVRGAPLELGAMTFTDPFTYESLSFGVPTVSLLDRPGTDDLDWLVPDAHVEVHLVRSLTGQMPSYMPADGTVVLPSDSEPYELTDEVWWVGSVISFNWDWSSGGSRLTVECKGMLHQLDNYLAKPEYLTQPISYERAIIRQFVDRPDLRMSIPQIEWPDWWATTYVPAPEDRWFNRPMDLSEGDRYSGLLTRDTGTFTPALTGYIQSLLSAMYSDRGQWTLRMRGVTPVLQHRDHLTSDVESTFVVSLTQPGVQMNVSEDWSQSTNVVYGSGAALNDVAYSGLQFTGDGETIDYVPLAASRLVYPANASNVALDARFMRRESSIQMSDALTRAEAEGVGRGHLRRFARPGLTAQMTLGSDVSQNDQPVSRYLIRAGDSIRVLGMFGVPDGALFHVTSATVDFASQQVSLELDTKFRDKLTVDEIRAKGRDALSVTRSLLAGRFALPVDDLLYPWNAELGSGVIPSGAKFNAAPLLNRMPYEARFPWENWTMANPPSEYPEYYVRIPPKSSNANKNWSLTAFEGEGAPAGYPVLLAQSAQIAGVWVAAYHADGSLFRVPFHFSLWWVRATDYTSTPVITEFEHPDGYDGYPPGQFYPFFPNAWETVWADGTSPPYSSSAPWQEGQLIVAYGVYNNRAGYYPGAQYNGDSPTGLLVDESGFSIQATDAFDPYDRNINLREPYRVSAAAMFYCDQQGAEDVYFMGRMIRRPPGSSR